MNSDEQHASLRGAAAYGTAWSLADRWGVRVASLVTFAILGRLLEPAEFGLIAAAQVIIMLLQSVSNQGIIQALVVAPEVSDRLRATATTVALMVATLTVVAVIACAPLLAGVFNQRGFVPVVAALSATFILQAVASVPMAELQRKLEFRRLAKRSVVSALAGAITGIFAAFAGWGVWALVAQSLTQSVVATILACTAARIHLRFAWHPEDLRQLMRFAGPVMLADVVAVGIGQGDNLVVGAVLGAVALGYYVIAFRLLSVLIDAFTGVISTVALPIFSRLAHNKSGTRAAYLQATQFSFGLATPVFLGMAVAAPAIVRFTFGAQWDESVPIFQILCFAGIATSALYFDRPVILAAKLPGLELAISVVLAAATIAAALVGAQFGLTATAACVTARMYLTWPLRFVALQRAVSIPLREYLGRLRGAFIAACFQGAASASVLLAARESGPVAPLAAAAVGVAVYATVLWFSDRTLIAISVSLVSDARRFGRLSRPGQTS